MIGIEFCKFNEDYGNQWYLKLCNWLIKLPFKSNKPPRDQMIDYYGFHIDLEMRHMRFSWSKHYSYFYLPWMLDYCQTEVMLNNGKFVVYEKFKVRKFGKPIIEEIPEPSEIFKKDYDYEYQLKNGEIQKRIATVTVERRTWWWRWFYWLGWPKKSVTCIEIQFNDEVGERTGSWKGGVIGCSYEMLPHECSDDTIKRMERERKF